jgi:hypothetical protein
MPKRPALKLAQSGGLSRHHVSRLNSSGSDSIRVGDRLASARSLPAFSCSTTDGGPHQAIKHVGSAEAVRDRRSEADQGGATG